MERPRRGRPKGSNSKQPSSENENELSELKNELNQLIDNSKTDELLRNLQKRRVVQESEDESIDLSEWDQEQKRIAELWARIKSLNAEYSNEKSVTDNCESVNELEDEDLLDEDDSSSDESEEVSIRKKFLQKCTQIVYFPNDTLAEIYVSIV